MTTEAQRLADRLQKHGHAEEAALLRRQEEALMQAREVLENSCIRWPEVDEALDTLNELLGEQT